jgi:hypothetical protein
MDFNDVPTDNSRIHVHLHVMVQCDMVLTAVGFPVISRNDFRINPLAHCDFAPCISSPTQLHVLFASACIAQMQPYISARRVVHP